MRTGSDRHSWTMSFPPLTVNVLATVAVAAPLMAQTLPSTLPSADSAAQRGLEYLAKHQTADGSCDWVENRVAITGLAVTAFLACGHTPDVGRYGIVVRGGIDYLLAQAKDDG